MTDEIGTDGITLRTYLDSSPLPAPGGRNRRYFWTTTEVSLLRQNWTALGIRGCAALLPGRSAQAIYSRAGALGLRAPEHARTGFRRRRLPNSAHMDDAIRACWATGPRRGEVRKLAAATGRSRDWLKRRAMTLGLSRLREKGLPWTAEEREFVAARAAQSSISISRAMRKRGWSRTATAVTVQLKRMHASRRDVDLMSARQVGLALGIDSHVVRRWVEKYGLAAERRGTARTEKQGGDEWVISRRALRNWIADHAATVNLGKISDPEWFIDLMAHP